MNQEKRTNHEANETVQALESGAVGFRPDEREVHELGKLIRESASNSLPHQEESVRNSISVYLDSLEDNVEKSGASELKVTDSKIGKRYRVMRWTVAATLLVAVGGAVFLNNRQEIWTATAALNEDVASASYAEDSGPPTNGEPDVEIEGYQLIESDVQKPVAGQMKPETKSVDTQSLFSLANPEPNTRPATTGLVRHLTPSNSPLVFEKKSGQNSANKFDAYSVPGSNDKWYRGESNPTVTVPDGGTVLLGGIKRSYNELGSETLVRNGNVNPSYLFRWKDLGSEVPSRGRFQEQPQNTEAYESITENQFVRALGGHAISTFSIDVDTASYANVRRFLRSGQLPPPNAVRIEEMVNYFDYDYPQPDKDQPFSVSMELADCPWNSSSKLLRVGLKGKEVHRNERPPTNVVFLLDVSGSMNDQAKLPLLKRGFKMMVDRLGKTDNVSIVTYAGNAGVVLEPTPGDQKKSIHEAIESLTPGGSTHGSAGIELAYQLAQKNFIHNGVNKVVLATDGDLNVGVTSDDALVKLITQKASENVFLTVLGFGTGNLKDAKMEKLADHGNGLYAYIDTIREAHKVLVEEMSGSLVTIAKDVKIQIEFNPAEVKSYRLIGYENRMLATTDFDDDRKDAGEIGAGHTVTALYEVVTTESAIGETNELPPAAQVLKYQNKSEPLPSEPVGSKFSEASKSGELMTLALRYKQPDESTSKRIEYTLPNVSTSFSAASEDFRFSASVAGTGMLLRHSRFSGDTTLEMLEEIAANSIGEDVSGYRTEFVDLIRQIRKLTTR